MKTFGILAMGSVLAACTTPVPPVPIPSSVTPLPGTEFSAATDVSDSGRIVGWYGSQAAEFQTAGDVTLLPSLPGYAWCRAVAIANDGTTAGTCVRAEDDPAPPRWRAVYWDSARALHPLIDLGPTVSTGVIDMNAAGVILGFHTTDGARITYWIYDLRTGTRRDLPQPQTGLAEPRALNDAGDIAGVLLGAPNSGNRRPIQWSRSTLAITVLPTLLNCSAEANDINNHGVVVGFGCYGVYGDHSSALVWPSATELPEVLPAPASPVSGYRLQRVSATSLNDAGDIIGFAWFGQGDILGPMPGVGWTADRQLALFEGTTPNAINDSRVTVGVGAVNRAVLIDW